MKLEKGKIYHKWLYVDYVTAAPFVCDLCHKPRRKVHEFIHPDTEYGQDEPMHLGSECLLKFIDYGFLPQ